MSAEFIPASKALPRFHVVRRWVPEELEAKLKAWSPKSDLGRIVMECFAYLPNELAADLLDRITSCVVLESSWHWSISTMAGGTTTA